MSDDRVFLDTNILVYCFDTENPQKQMTAYYLTMENCVEARAVISYQVQQEFVNVAIRRIKARAEIRRRLEGMSHFALGMRIVQSSEKILNRAIYVWDRYAMSWYDSLIIAAALESDCTILYTEDMQHGMEIDGMRIVNPFL